MGRVAIEPSQEVARLLKARRRELGWTLRQVEEETRRRGRVVHFSTLARVERGRVDPGIRRLHLLFKIYDLPVTLLDDLLEIEEFAGELPGDKPTARLYEDAVRDWKAGNLRRALAGLAELRALAPADPAGIHERHKALLSVAVTIGSIGRYRLAKHLVEDLLLEKLEPDLLVPALVEAATCWARLGSEQVALGLLASAEANAEPGAHRHLALVLHSRASTLTSTGEYEEAALALERALVEYRNAHDLFGECQAMGVRVRLAFEQGDAEGALEAARAARSHAEAHDFGRLVAQRLLDEGHALVDLGKTDDGLAALSAGLARAVAAQDPVAQFFGHHHLWKAHLVAKDTERAEMELQAARYFVQFVDADLPEATEIRERARHQRPGVSGVG